VRKILMYDDRPFNEVFIGKILVRISNDIVN
jgi:hypothetical protein